MSQYLAVARMSKYFNENTVNESIHSTKYMISYNTFAVCL